MDNPIFIGGLMKSGTSLLRVLLGQHHRLFGGFETHWFEPAVREAWEDPSSPEMKRLLSFYELGPGDYQMLCDRKRAQPEREFLDVFMDYCVERAGRVRWVEKTPDNIRHFTLIQQSWKRPVLVHVTREYKDVYASWKVRKGASLERFIASVNGAYEQIRELAGTTSPTYLELDYNDMVVDTEVTVRRVLDHVGETWDPACAQVDTDTTSLDRQKLVEIVGKDSPTFQSLTKPVFTTSVGQWRTMITDDEAKRIERELAPWYQLYGKRWS